MLFTTTTAARALQPIAPIRPKATPMRDNPPWIEAAAVRVAHYVALRSSVALVK